MAHIADFMVDATSSAGLNNYIARELSPHPPAQDTKSAETTPTEEKEKFIWRMHQPAEPRKYQLFPVKEKLSISANSAGRKSPEPESVFSMAMGKPGNPEKERSLHAAALRLKPKEQSLIRRRKVSVPELGPMTTVQEVAMDSPTIPGRPALHERSISAPGNSWRQHVFGESMVSCIDGPAPDENAEIDLADIEAAMAALSAEVPTHNSTWKARSLSPKRSMSPRTLAPLVIPSPSIISSRLAPHKSSTRVRSESIPPDVPPKSARMKEASPLSRGSPFTPMSSTYSILTTAPTSLATTPNTAVTGDASPWTASSGPSPVCHHRGQSETGQSRAVPVIGHRRGDSEASIMDRGRPKKRSESSPSKPTQGKLCSSDERRAFETLPQGVKATDASAALPAHEIEALRKQAISQAARFEVLTPRDVETLSRELRGLDERCDYLRKTHRSLRSGRRNLHDRICSYLRSPRVARFSHESILKQEEALSELDRSIDDWVSKLEQAENRRTRIRQKLLEHVAAALIIQPSATSTNAGAAPAITMPGSQDEKLDSPMHVGMQRALMGENTPPRSPTKSMSPQRLAEPVRADNGDDTERKPVSIARRDVESIRIYADSDMYALLADVEEEINRMGEAGEKTEKTERDARDEAEMMGKSRDVPESMASGGMMLSALAFDRSVLARTGFA